MRILNKETYRDKPKVYESYNEIIELSNENIDWLIELETRYNNELKPNTLNYLIEIKRKLNISLSLAVTLGQEYLRI